MTLPIHGAVDILLVEDSPTDALITREALTQARVLNRLHHVEDGYEALEFLRRQGAHAEAPRPGLILLDLNLPKKSGLDVLTEIKSDPNLQTIPVVVLTTSRATVEVDAAYRQHANCFITKPVEFEDMARCICALENFWFSIVTLPPPAK
ncbi:response regulator receiver protein [Chthoniobacter flavus Ellin428]|uniref:Response regulator receiver protein n=1 Tax=Chthoniobacter flavus Ellin428 TaxID=497964 RepID=B4D4F5_9BACT|nr:response regulator [Chthoniobacter flavus]EDY18756.1 response regulator receiver protein [Chthoniobacter flavus Ellin428]TCO89004.1 CheY-like chemotaxis protein [Chthoniobacter flavus]